MCCIIALYDLYLASVVPIGRADCIGVPKVSSEVSKCTLVTRPVLNRSSVQVYARTAEACTNIYINFVCVSKYRMLADCSIPKLYTTVLEWDCVGVGLYIIAKVTRAFWTEIESFQL